MRFRLLVLLAGCNLAPAYHRPAVSMPATDAYKEWKVATPADAIPRGRWWTMFRDPELDGLVAHLDAHNQTIIQAVENYIAACAQIRSVRLAPRADREACDWDAPGACECSRLLRVASAGLSRAY